MSTIAAQTVQKLNAYDGDNFWQDIIVPAGVDDHATEVADPHGRSDIAIFRDGSEVYFREDTGRWYTAQD